MTWNSWTQEWSPERLRGKYFGFRNGLIQAATVLFLLLVWGTLRLFQGSLPALQGVFLVSIALRAWSIVAQHRLNAAAPAAARRPAFRGGSSCGRSGVRAR